MAEVDPAWWWLPGAADVHIDPPFDTEEVFRFGEDDLFAMAEAVGARSLNAVDVFGGSWTVDEAAEAFAGLCARAAEHGLLVHLEWLPWSRIPDLATALADRRNGPAPPNGGLNVDAWHLVRAGCDVGRPGRRARGRSSSASSSTTARWPPRRTWWRPRCTTGDCPGEGEFDLVGLLRALAATGTTAPRSGSRCSATSSTARPRPRRPGGPPATTSASWRRQMSGVVVFGTGFGCVTHVRALRAAGFDVVALVGQRPGQDGGPRRPVRHPAWR